MFGSLGAPELLVILVVALLVFGPKKLPDLGRSLGEAIRGFRKATNESDTPIENSETIAKSENTTKS